MLQKLPKKCLVYASELNINKVVARVMEGNEVSNKIINNLGFTYTHSFIEDQKVWSQYQLIFNPK
ncbi:RimJ/RimL family protein N-acetyltransferase [Flammeovirga kamogawensis]|nr:RimJ/RimL family protein N-acetyltransferase [Flammeovirga kamogawensis]